jgi:hypothetical protein
LKEAYALLHTLLRRLFMSGPHGGGGERCLSLAYKICKKNKEDRTSV